MIFDTSRRCLQENYISLSGQTELGVDLSLVSLSRLIRLQGSKSGFLPIVSFTKQLSS